MKVGTLTFHMAENYGAALQAYALCTVINKMGYDCEIINFTSDQGTNLSTFEWPCDLIKKYGLFKGLIKAANRWRLGIYSKKSKTRNFAYFIKKYFKMSEVYDLTDSLNNLKYDAIVFGGDQIWNAKITQYATNIYMGSFDKRNAFKKLSYAVSSGNEDIIGDTEEIKRRLNDFSAISVREEGLAKFIKDAYDIDTNVVLDPVFLLDETEWKRLKGKLPSKLKKKGYILTYTFEGQPVYEYAIELGRKMGLPVVIMTWTVSPDRTQAIQLVNSGPIDFLTLIDEAAMVCTSSFHGTAFSIIFKKEIYCLTSRLNGHRIDNLMQKIGKCVDDEYDGRNVYHCVPEFFEDKQDLLKEMKKESLDFLKFSLEG